MIESCVPTRLPLEHALLNGLNYSQASFRRTASRLVCAEESYTFVPALDQGLFILYSAEAAEAADKKYDRTTMHIYIPLVSR